MSLLHPVKSLVTAFTLAAGFLLSNPASAQQKIPPAADTTGIGALRREMARTELGEDLIAFADKHRVVMAFDSTLAKKGEHGGYSMNRNILTIDPYQSVGDQVTCAAHELRHVWHHFTLKADSVLNAAIDPHHVWALQRHMEADAHAFSFYFLADRIDKLGTEDSTMLYNPVELWIANNLRNEIKSPDGLTPEEYRQQGLSLTFCGLSGYNEKHDRSVRMQLGMMEFFLKAAFNRIEAGKFELAEKPLSLYMDMRNNAPDDAAMATYLRNFGGTSLDPKAPTALSDTVAVDDQTLIHGLPLYFNMDADGGSFPQQKAEALKELNDYLHQMNAAGDILVEKMAAWRSAQKPVTTSSLPAP